MKNLPSWVKGGLKASLIYLPLGIFGIISGTVIGNFPITYIWPPLQDCIYIDVNHTYNCPYSPGDTAFLIYILNIVVFFVIGALIAHFRNRQS